jgi:hypothetical protein
MAKASKGAWNKDYSRIQKLYPNTLTAVAIAHIGLECTVLSRVSNQETEELEQIHFTKDRSVLSSDRAPEVNKDCSCHDLRLKCGRKIQEGLDIKPDSLTNTTVAR